MLFRSVADLNFTALPGEIIALVGPTGAGKSTALALLHRVFDPQSGSIRIDGMDIRGLKLAALRRNIGVVFQEVLLFNRSIADNLRVGKPDASEEAVTEAQISGNNIVSPDYTVVDMGASYKITPAFTFHAGVQNLLYRFGQISHALQDFYSHSNWLELSRVPGKNWIATNN